MGVDYSVVAGYGRTVEIVDDSNGFCGSFDEINEKLPDGFSLLEAGSASYGGKRYLIVVETATSIDANYRECGFEKLPDRSPMSALTVEALEDVGLKSTSEPSWFVGMHVW